MNRTVKKATVNRYHYDSHEQLRAHLADFVTAYNFARRLKILKGLSPYEYIVMPGQTSQAAYRRSDPPNAGTKQLGAGKLTGPHWVLG
jgi:hypothetical protein